MILKQCSLSAAIALLIAPFGADASSHREAPFLTEMPKVDGTDFYMFNSYEEGRDGYVTLIANYIPFQEPFGGPNYYTVDENAVYEIHIDNNGDAVEDVSFQFRFNTRQNDIALPIGEQEVPIPLRQGAPVAPSVTETQQLNLFQEYEVEIVRGDRRDGEHDPVRNAADNSKVFTKPVDYIGQKTIPQYEAYAQEHIYDIEIPDCENGRMFVGQRNDPFYINVGEIFDLINTDPLGARDGEVDQLQDNNVTTIALEIPTDCLVASDSGIIGGWTTASVRQFRELNPEQASDNSGEGTHRGQWVQVSRLGMPLVNEVVIGLPDKNRFNASEPSEDAQFLTYVTHPTLPALISTLFPDVPAPEVFPREDLVSVFLTGVPELNQPADVVPSEQLRLNTTIPAVPASEQDPLGVLGGDQAGFPNGRRPGDDVVDIELRVAMGVLLSEEQAPAGQMPFTDGAAADANDYDEVFPYLTTPLPGSPSDAVELVDE